METLKTLILRIVAVFGSSALAAVAGGAVLDVELWKAAAIAGIVAAAKVTEALLRAWSSDGVLTKRKSLKRSARLSNGLSQEEGL